jgi:hypothetical protein
MFSLRWGDRGRRSPAPPNVATDMIPAWAGTRRSEVVNMVSATTRRTIMWIIVAAVLIAAIIVAVLLSGGGSGTGGGGTGY